MVSINTCLLEGLRPQESRILCPPIWVPFNIDNACSAQDLKQTIQTNNHINQVRQGKGGRI